MSKIAPRTDKPPKQSAAEQKRLIKKLDTALSKIIRERDGGKPCIELCGETHYVWQAGHFRPRGMMMTRFHPKNVNRQQSNCNYYKSRKNDVIRHRLGIDLRWGAGTADELYDLSVKYKNWSCDELRTLIEAAKKGIEEYTKVYESLP